MDGYKGVKIKLGTLADAFEEFLFLEREGKLNFPVVRDELQYHAVGCYSVVHGVEKLNRIAEHSLLAAERIATISSLLISYKYPKEEIRNAWKKVLFNQFHDILAGTSIRKAYEEEVIRNFHYAIQTADDIITFSIKSIEKDINVTGKGSFFILWNLNAFPVKFPVEYEVYLTDIEDADKAVLRDLDGNIIPFEKLPLRSKTFARRLNMRFISELPALGYKVYNVVEGDVRESKEPKIISGNGIENSFFKIVKDSEVSFKVIDKQNALETFRSGAFALLVLDDYTDTWTHETNQYLDEGEFIKFTEYTAEATALGQRLKCKGYYNDSYVELKISIYNGLSFIDLEILVDWHEKHKLLKMILPFELSDPTVTVEIPYGSIVRKDEYIERPMQRWADVTGKLRNGEKYGVTVVNDGVYSYDFRNGKLRITLLRSPLYAHHTPYKAKEYSKDEYTDQGVHKYRFLILPHKGDVDKSMAVEMASVLNNPPIGVLTFSHGGRYGHEKSFLEVEPDNVKVEVIKRGEKSDDIIVRLYEVEGKKTKGQLSLLGSEFDFEIGKYEIKTFSLNLAEKRIKEVNMLEDLVGS